MTDTDVTAIPDQGSAPPPRPPADILPPTAQQVEEIYDGSYERKEHPSVESAAKEVAARRRHELPQDEILHGIAEWPEVAPIIPVEYQDGRDKDAKVTVTQAAKDLGQYRAEVRAEQNQKLQALLNELTGQPPAEAQQAAPEWQPEPQPAPAEQPTQPPEQKWQAAEQSAEIARQTYVLALNTLLFGNEQAAREFSDIKTTQDLARLSNQDPARLQQYYANFQRHQALQQELGRVREQQRAIAAQEFEPYSKNQDALVEAMVPELSSNADASVRTRLQTEALEMLQSAGFDNKELTRAWNGGERFSMRDARVQRVIADAAKWRMAQAKAVAAAKKPVPPVQRPGVSQRTFQADYLPPLKGEMSLKDAAKYRAAVLAQRRV